MFTERFTIVFQSGTQRLAEQAYSGSVFRVMLHLVGTLDFVRFKKPQQGRIADALGIGQPTISKAIAVLTSDGFLEKQGCKFRLSADFGWRGKAGLWHAHQRERARSRWLELDLDGDRKPDRP